MNPVQILSKTLVDYPKSPARGDLIRVIKKSGTDPWGLSIPTDDDYRPGNLCACLLGQVIVSGGVEPKEVYYDHISDGNGIEDSVKFLWQAIKGRELPVSAAVSDVYGDVYRFNDITLKDGETCTVEEDGTVVTFTYSAEVVTKVTEKIQEALNLAKKAEALKALDAAQDAVAAAKAALA